MAQINIVGEKNWPHLVLIVDDEPDVCEVLQGLLKLMQIRSVAVNDGQRALEVLKTQQTFDLVISDIKMPHLNGIELLKEMRSLGFTMPVMILTAHGDQKLVREAWQNGAYDFIDKPFNDKELEEKIKLALRFGGWYNMTFRPEVEVNKEVVLRLNSQLWEKLQRHCEKRGFDIHKTVNRLLARYLGSLEDMI